MTKSEVIAKIEESKSAISAELNKMSDAVAGLDEAPATSDVEELKKKIEELSASIVAKDEEIAAAKVAFEVDEAADEAALQAEKAKTAEIQVKIDAKNVKLDELIAKAQEAKDA